MSAQELSQKLSELQSELAENPELDEQTRRSLSAVLGEIQVAIDRAAQRQSVDTAEGTLTGEDHDATVAENSISHRVREVIDDFEAKHPRLTMTLSLIADRLAEIGI